MEDPFELPPDVLRRIPLFAELSKVLAWSGGAVNWDIGTQVAISMAAGSAPDPAVDAADAAAVAEHVRVAQMWLTAATGLPEPHSPTDAHAVTPIGWVEGTRDRIAELIDPVAAKLTSALAEQAGDGAPAGGLQQALGQIAPMLMGVQAGTILGTLAREVTGSHELGFPAASDPVSLVVPTIDRVAEEYELDAALVRQTVALHAEADRMFYGGISFARARFFSLFHNYIATLRFDFSESMRRLQELDIGNPEAMQSALGDQTLFAPETSPQTQRAAEAVGSFIALVQAHIEAAVASAGTRAGDIARVEEAFRRRAASGATGVAMLKGFLGIDDAPYRTRARAFVRGALGAADWETLLRAWEDPEAFPREEELDDPTAWVGRIAR
ncbi:MAG TPA: zinc-dependent metalloprotease [Actinomycetota bacterium]